MDNQSSDFIAVQLLKAFFDRPEALTDTIIKQPPNRIVPVNGDVDVAAHPGKDIY